MIPTILLFSALNALALAAPHTKRACNAKNHHNGTLSISASGGAASLDAVAAVAQGHGHKSTSTRYHTTTVVPKSSSHTTAHSTSIAVIHSSAIPPPVHSSAIASIHSSAITQPTSKSTAAPAPTSTTTTPSNGKPTLPAGSEVGIGWNSNSGSALDSFINAPGSKLSWYTGWNLQMSTLPAAKDLEFVGEVWGPGDVNNVYAATSSWPANTKAILSFNEPNQDGSVGGSNMKATDAATQHIQWVSNLKEKANDYLIGAPAISRVDPNANNWLDDWIKACDGKCVYDFVPIHFYGTDASQLTTYTDIFYARYKKPLWITEFACWDFSTNVKCTESQAEDFITQATQHFRGVGKGSVVRWAWFGAWSDMASGGNANGLEDTTGAANTLGKHYVSS